VVGESLDKPLDVATAQRGQRTITEDWEDVYAQSVVCDSGRIVA